MPSCPAGRHLPELGFACAEAEVAPLSTHQAPTPLPLDTCDGAAGALNFDPACGPEHSRTPDTGACASTACTALVGSFDNEKVEQMAAGFALCAEQCVEWAASFADVDRVKAYRIKNAADKCGLTAPFSPPRFDTCLSAQAATDLFHSACGPEGDRTPDTGACASTACTALVASFTDAKVELIAAGFASCTGEDHHTRYADVEMVKIEQVNKQADKCGLTAPFSPPRFDTCLSALAADDFYSACGPEDDRTPDTGACASTACTALVASFTDEKVEQMAAGFASCTGEYADHYARYAATQTSRW